MFILLRRVVTGLASLRLTVVLFSLAMFLIFAGTLAQASQGIWQTVDGYFRSTIAWVDLQLFIPRQIATVSARFPFPGGGLIGAGLIINLIAAHVVRFKWSTRRIGIIVLHAGLIFMLAGEFVTGKLAVEGLMSIDEGHSANYTEDIREVELAYVDRSGEDRDKVVAIPQRLLVEAARTGGKISHEALPVSISVDRWMSNSQLIRRREAVNSPADRGVGLEAEARLLPEVAGVDSQQVNAPSAYVTLWQNDERLGTWLVSVNADVLQPAATGDISLRFKRTYKPYTLHLIDFRHDKFVGTEVARNFSSQIRLIDPTRDTDREVLIYMNNPLRYAGETFYQASFKPDNSGTVLQVVRNPGWLIPYLSCVLVTIGMLWHFSAAMLDFLRRNRNKPVIARSAPIQSPLQRWVAPGIVGAIGIAIAVSGLFRPTHRSAYDVDTFVQLPVSAGGRVKPIDTVARNALMISGGRQTARVDDHTKIDAGQFLLDLMARPEIAQEYPVVRVDHPDVLALLDRSPSEGNALKLSDLRPHWARVSEQAGRAAATPSRQRDPFQRAVLDLSKKVDHLLSLSRMEQPYTVPPFNADEEWQPVHQAFLAARTPQGSLGENMHPAARHLIEIMTAYHEEKPGEFNAAVRRYYQALKDVMPAEMRRARLEWFFNRAAPFYTTTIIYVLAFLVSCAALLTRLHPRFADGVQAFGTMRRCAIALLYIGLVVHTAALLVRIYLQGRPPVTNLYSSAVFVGWACVLLALVLERFYPLVLAALAASIIGAGTLIIAHNLGSDGDTLQMMQAVLDSNFWLATHVITVTLGYSATFLAGFLGIAYIGLGLFTRFLTPERSKALAKMVYCIVCFALLLSFVGTVLGGIWADQSWGRFWGWDPKENGAVLVVLINALVLHARWAGLIRHRGIMIAVVGGNIVTAWSWFGTNMLGIGLHAYGFMESAVFWLLLFVFTQLLIMALALLPARAWRSGTVSG